MVIHSIKSGELFHKKNPTPQAWDFYGLFRKKLSHSFVHQGCRFAKQDGALHLQAAFVN